MSRLHVHHRIQTPMVSAVLPVSQEKSAIGPHPWWWAFHFVSGMVSLMGALFYNIHKKQEYTSSDKMQAIIAPFQEKISALELALAEKKESNSLPSEEFSTWIKLFEEMKPQKMLQALHKMPAEKAMSILQALKPHQYKKIVALLPSETLSRWMSSIDQKLFSAQKNRLEKTSD